MYEKKHQPLAPARMYYKRIAWNFLFTLIIVTITMAIGTGGFIFSYSYQTLASLDLNGLTYANTITVSTPNTPSSAINVQNSSATPAILNGNIDLSKGTYFVRLVSNDTVYTTKLLVE